MGTTLIDDGELATLLFCKIKMSNQFGGIASALPLTWTCLKLPDIMRLIRNLDPESKGVVDWRTLFNYIALERSTVPVSIDVSGLKTENGFAEKKDFVSHKWWFAESERSTDREYSHTFERV